MSAATANAIDDGWVLDEPIATSAAPAPQPVSADDGSSVDDGWCLDDEPVAAPVPKTPPVLTIVADYEDELEADIEIVSGEADGWAISDEEAAFFAAGEALATAKPASEDFSDLGAVKPESGFLRRLFSRAK